MNEIGTAEISGVQAAKILGNYFNKVGDYVKVPKTNSYVKLYVGPTIRKLHPKFRKNKSKAFQLKGNIDIMRELVRFLQTGEGKSISMKVTTKK